MAVTFSWFDCSWTAALTRWQQTKCVPCVARHRLRVLLAASTERGALAVSAVLKQHRCGVCDDAQDGYTALHLSGIHGRLEIAMLLLERGVDKDVKASVRSVLRGYRFALCGVDSAWGALRRAEC